MIAVASRARLSPPARNRTWTCSPLSRARRGLGLFQLRRPWVLTGLCSISSSRTATSKICPNRVRVLLIVRLESGRLTR